MLGNGWRSVLCLTHTFYLPLVLTARDGQFIYAESKLGLFHCTRVIQLVGHASICYTLHPVLWIMATCCILGKSVLLVSYSSFDYFTMPTQSEMSRNCSLPPRGYWAPTLTLAYLFLYLSGHPFIHSTSQHAVTVKHSLGSETIGYWGSEHVARFTG